MNEPSDPFSNYDRDIRSYMDELATDRLVEVVDAAETNGAAVAHFYPDVADKYTADTVTAFLRVIDPDGVPYVADRRFVFSHCSFGEEEEAYKYDYSEVFQADSAGGYISGLLFDAGVGIFEAVYQFGTQHNTVQAEVSAGSVVLYKQGVWCRLTPITPFQIIRGVALERSDAARERERDFDMELSMGARMRKLNRQHFARQERKAARLLRRSLGRRAIRRLGII